MNTVSTLNWDTAFGIRFKDANAAIVGAGSSPPRFDGAHDSLGATYQVGAGFGPWQMTGGAGSLLTMTLPLTGGTIAGGGQPDAAFAATAQIQVSLGFIPQPGTPASQQLRIDQTQAVSVLQVTLASGPASALDAIRGALQDWLNANLSQFNHVFAVVDLNTALDPSDSFAWLKPTHVGYAIYTENIASPDDYVFGVLAMTENRPGLNLSPQIDPGIIPAGADAGFLIAAPRVVDKMFAPQIETLFDGASPDDFDRQDDGMTIVNVARLEFTDFTLEDGTVIDDAGLDAAGFTMSIGTGYVQIRFSGLKFTWQDKYNVVVNYASTSQLSTDSNGHLQLTQTTAPSVSVNVTETDAQKWREIWESIGISVAVAVVGAVLGAAAEAGLARAAASSGAEASTNGVVNIEMQTILNGMTPQQVMAGEVTALRTAIRALQEPEAPQTFAGLFRAASWKLLGTVIGAVIGAGVAGIVTALQAYADENSEDMPTLDSFGEQATSNVKWTGASGYCLQSAVLRGALQLALVKGA
ncbi:TULIP family P47-like protein [[Empedobacter] haloabium]|uniref:TULIP family P47-like protein n=1 Tax=[Empedobacter] haloabium TaxID=592317 RepID=A0ABZ1UT27_9BURK